MTATINPQDATEAGGRFEATRLLPITVNLLPEEVLQARAGRNAMRGASALLLAALVGTGAWYYTASKDADSAATQLSTAQAAAAVASKGKDGFTELNAVKAQISSIHGELATATTGDVDWAKVNNSIRGAIISGKVALSGISDTAGDAASGGSTVAPTTTTTTTGAGTPAVAAGPTGSVVITGVATTQKMVGAYALNLAKLPVLSKPSITTMSTDPVTHDTTFTVNANTTPAALNTRYQKVSK